MSDPHVSGSAPVEDEPLTPPWLPALGAGLFVVAGLWWVATPPVAPAADAAPVASAPAAASASASAAQAVVAAPSPTPALPTPAPTPTVVPQPPAVASGSAKPTRGRAPAPGTQPTKGQPSGQARAATPRP